MKIHITLFIALLYAVCTFAEPEPEPRGRLTVGSLEVPVAQSDDNKFYVLFGRNRRAENVTEVTGLRQGGQFDVAEDENVELQSFVPVHDENLGTLLIPSNALDKVAEDSLEDIDEDDSESLGRARRRRGGRRRGARRRRKMRRRHRRRRKKLMRRYRRNRRRRQKARHRHRRRRRKGKRRHRRRRRRRRSKVRNHRRRRRSRHRKRSRRNRRRRRNEEEKRRKEEEEYDY